MPTKPVMDLKEVSFDAAVGSGVALVDFWAPWCSPCVAMGPVIKELAGSVDGQVTIGKVNVEENPELAARFQVTSIPLIVVLHDGQEVERAVGAQPVSRLLEMITASR